MKHLKNISVIGGDMRQVYAINELARKGFQIYYYGISHEKITSSAKKASSFKEALAQSEILLCPIPFTKDQIHLFTMKTEEKCSIAEFIENLLEKHVIIGGAIPKSIVSLCDTLHVTVNDLMRSDDFALMNAIATAEGTIAEAIKASAMNLHGSQSLVIGYGRCAKILAKKLSALDANVTIAARRQSALIEAAAFGYSGILLSELEHMLPAYHFIFNTVPSLILTKNHMPLIQKEAVLLDIATAPGGQDDFAG